MNEPDRKIKQDATFVKTFLLFGLKLHVFILGMWILELIGIWENGVGIKLAYFLGWFILFDEAVAHFAPAGWRMDTKPLLTSSRDIFALGLSTIATVLVATYLEHQLSELWLTLILAMSVFLGVLFPLSSPKMREEFFFRKRNQSKQESVAQQLSSLRGIDIVMAIGLGVGLAFSLALLLFVLTRLFPSAMPTFY